MYGTGFVIRPSRYRIKPRAPIAVIALCLYVIQFEPSSASWGILKSAELVPGSVIFMVESGLITCEGYETGRTEYDAPRYQLRTLQYSPACRRWLELDY